MADARVKVLLVMSVILIQNTVQAYYCDSDECQFDEYCCGANVCCTSYNVWQMWYFWCGLVLFLILLFACAGFWRYKYYTQPVVIQGNNKAYSKFGEIPMSMHIRTDSDQSTVSDWGNDVRKTHLRTDSDLSVLSDDLTQYPEFSSHRTVAPEYSTQNYGHSGPPSYSQVVGGHATHYSKTHRDSHRDALLETDY